MSLALTAASFDSVDNNSSNNNSSGTVPLHKRRTIKNRNSYVGADDQENLHRKYMLIKFLKF